MVGFHSEGMAVDSFWTGRGPQGEVTLWRARSADHPGQPVSFFAPHDSPVEVLFAIAGEEFRMGRFQPEDAEGYTPWERTYREALGL
jgi:hypothetical protein